MIVKRRFVLIGLAACLATGGTQAQQPAGAPVEAVAAAGHRNLRIREVTGLGRNALMRTAQYNASGLVAKMPSRDWAQITVLFDTLLDKDAWLDDLGVQFHVLLYNRMRDEYALLRNSQQLFDVGPGRGHQSTMFVRPSALLRYGEVVGVAVELRVKGEVVDALSDSKLPGGKKLPAKWWENTKLTLREGYLLKKADTPFAMLAVDDYEYVK